MKKQSRKSGLRREQKPWLGLVGEVAWGASLSLYEAIILWDKAWWWRMHYGLWRAYRGWNPDKVLDAIEHSEDIATLAYGETPASTVRRILDMCREHFPESNSLVDLGAGRGIIAMTAASLGWDVLAVEYVGEFRRRSEPLCEKLNLSVQWVDGDFLLLPFVEADIIHTAATCFNQDFRDRLADKLYEECNTSQGILIQDWVLDDERFEALLGIRLPVTWGSSYFTLHRKREL